MSQPERVDYEYERKGTRNLFVLVEPLARWRHVEVTAQRTMQGYARIVCWLVDEVYPHTPASLYETFPPADARRILQRLEFHYTPKHGSRLNMAEIEIAILERNALSLLSSPVSCFRLFSLGSNTLRAIAYSSVHCTPDWPGKRFAGLPQWLLATRLDSVASQP